MSETDPTLESLLNSAYRYAHALCAHAEMAEDLVHESWLKVVARYGPQPSKALLFRSIRNLFIDNMRHSSRFPQDSIDEHIVLDEANNDPSHYASHDVVLAKGLNSLGSAEREVLFLWVFEGYTASEIAELTKQPRNTVLSQIHRAKAKLKNHLEQYGNQPLKVVTSTEEQSS